MKKDPESALLYREWKTPPAKAILLLIHGLGAHSGRWDALGRFFSEHSVSSYALELKGFGETKDYKGHIDSFNTYLADVKRLAEIAKRENESANVFLLGESLGALIAILTAKENPPLFNGLICISPAFVSKLNFSVLDYARILTYLLCNPKKHFNIPFNSAMCTRDKAYCEAMDKDVREHRLATPKFFLNTLKAQIKTASSKGWPDIPALFLIAGEDRLIDTKVSRKVFESLKIKDKNLIEYPEMYHSISIDIEKEKAFRDILTWLEKRI